MQGSTSGRSGFRPLRDDSLVRGCRVHAGRRGDLSATPVLAEPQVAPTAPTSQPSATRRRAGGLDRPCNVPRRGSRISTPREKGPRREPRTDCRRDHRLDPRVLSDPALVGALDRQGAAPAARLAGLGAGRRLRAGLGAAPRPAGESGVRITHVGGPTALIELDGRRLLADRRSTPPGNLSAERRRA